MPWIRTLSLDDADDKVLEAMAQQRTLYPREYAQPVQELDQGLPGIVASHTLIPEALYHAFATTSTAWRIRWGSAGIESWCKGTHRNCLPCGRAPSHYFVRSSWPLSCSSTSKRWPLGSRKKKRSKGVSRRGSITLAPWAIRRSLSVGKPARGRLSAMYRPYSCSNGEGWNSGTSTRCSSCPGAICSQAAGAALFRGRPISVQPRTSWKKAVDRASSRVARVTCASATIVLLFRLGLSAGCRSPHDNRRLVWDHRGTDAVSCMKILVFSRGDDERLKRRPEAEMLRGTNRESGPHSAGRPGRSDDEIAPTRRR